LRETKGRGIRHGWRTGGGGTRQIRLEDLRRSSSGREELKREAICFYDKNLDAEQGIVLRETGNVSSAHLDKIR